MAGEKLNGLAVGAVAVGGLIAWSGITNNSIAVTLKGLSGGKLPAAGPAANLGFSVLGSGPGSTAGAGGSTSTGSAIANDALKYVGHGYVWGGPSNVNGGWDCSSFVSWVLGHDLGMTIPGGSWAAETGSGRSHGPDVASYVLWGGAKSVSRANVSAGDLICWPPNTHIGIATSPTAFVSALNSSMGTRNIPIASNGGGWIARRLVA
jgi:cell wall-associated NlpC family hydrolase